ncbi:unnamed protein product [Spodoptera littoralis]|uniref:Uncharacterized protein n=1 Tax=Spodoptera littoralis TaxID=7109 RepID=A0A9P0N1U5_SPOLI|nr:unnamed protein product [Spodoptera littoralis]CAH1638467.1 unnamed protein product [Spodoptera littoralis]
MFCYLVISGLFYNNTSVFLQTVCTVEDLLKFFQLYLTNCTEIEVDMNCNGLNNAMAAALQLGSCIQLKHAGLLNSRTSALFHLLVLYLHTNEFHSQLPPTL